MKQLLALSLLLPCASVTQGFAQGRLVPLSDAELCRFNRDSAACERVKRARSLPTSSAETAVETWRKTPDGEALCFVASGLCDRVEGGARAIDGASKALAGVGEAAGRAGASVIDGAREALAGAGGALGAAAEWANGALDAAAEWTVEAIEPASVEGAPAFSSGHDTGAAEWNPDAAGPAWVEGLPAFPYAGVAGCDGLIDEEWLDCQLANGSVNAIEPGPVEGAPAFPDTGVAGCGWLTGEELLDCQLANVGVDDFGDTSVPEVPEPGWQASPSAPLTRDEVDAMRARALGDIADERSRREVEMAAMRERQGGFGKALGGFFKGLGSVGVGLLENADVIANTLQDGGNANRFGTANWFPPAGSGLTQTLSPDRLDCREIVAAGTMSMRDCQEAFSYLVDERLLRSDGSFFGEQHYDRKLQDMERRVLGRAYTGRNPCGGRRDRPGGGVC